MVRVPRRQRRSLAGSEAHSQLSKGKSVILTRRGSRLVAAFLALALFATACGGDGSDDGGSASDSGSDDTVEQSNTDGAESDASDEGGADDTADGSDVTSADDEVDSVQTGGTLRIALQTEAGSLNPTNDALNAGPQILARAIFDTLTVIDDDNNWHNNLSESWTPNEDFTSWEVTLRDGILFSDGGQLNADAVIATLTASLQDPLVGLVFRSAFGEGPVEETLERVDDLTVRINLDGPNAQLPFYFSTQIGMIGSPDWLAAAEDNPDLDQTPIGAGPYMIEERIQDQRTVLVRNPNYWSEPGLIDTFEFLPTPLGSARTDQLLSGDIDISHDTDAGSILALRDAGDDIQRVEDNSGEEFSLLLNAGSAPFDDIRVREAATLAFPKQQYLDFQVQGAALEADTQFSTETPWHVPGLEQIDDMPELAAPLIEAYCADVPDQCTDGRVNMSFQHDVSAENDDLAILVSDAWTDLFNVEVVVVPNDQHIFDVFLGVYDVATWRIPAWPDPDIQSIFLSCASISAISVNYSRNCNDEREALIQAQRATTDFDERYDLWAQIQENARDSFQYLILTHTNWVVATGLNVGGLCDATTPDGVALPCQDRGVYTLPNLFLTN